MQVPGLFPEPSTARISERSGSQVKGLTLPADAAVYGARRRGSARRQSTDLPISHGEDSQKPAQAGNPPGHRRPRHQRPARLRQSGGLSRLDRALSHRRGPGGAPLALSIWPARHPHVGSAGTGARGDRGRRLRRRRLAAVGPGGDLDRAACRSQAPAITSWSPTASIGRPAISARACSSAWASRRPITIR